MCLPVFQSLRIACTPVRRARAAGPSRDRRPHKTGALPRPPFLTATGIPAVRWRPRQRPRAAGSTTKVVHNRHNCPLERRSKEPASGTMRCFACRWDEGGPKCVPEQAPPSRTRLGASVVRSRCDGLPLAAATFTDSDRIGNAVHRSIDASRAASAGSRRWSSRARVPPVRRPYFFMDGFARR